MIFRRTPNGLSNLCLFYGVDHIVFVEGGTQSYTKEQVYEGKHNNDAVDIKFWKGIFSIFLKNNSFNVKAIGSKTTLLSIIEDIKAGKINNVYIAIDRDYDPFIAATPKDKFVVRTYGYSWENDVWQPEVVNEVLHTVCVVSEEKEKTLQEIRNIIAKFDRDLHIAVSADILLYSKGKSFIPRDKHLCLLTFGKKTLPAVSCKKIQDMLASKGLSMSDINIFNKKTTIIPFRDGYGHLMADFCYWLVVYLLNKASKAPAIAKQYISNIAVEKFIHIFSQDKFAELYNHYYSCLA